MATSLSLENDSSLAQGYIKVNGTTAATITTSGITGNLTGNVTGNSDTATKLAGTTGSAPSYACRAWVNFDGTRDTTGAVSTANTNRFIRSSGNVTSVLRNSTGSYTITFTTAMSDANFSFSFSGKRQDTAGTLFSTTATQTTSTLNINSWAADFVTGMDYQVICVQVFGN